MGILHSRAEGHTVTCREHLRSNYIGRWIPCNDVFRYFLGCNNCLHTTHLQKWIVGELNPVYQYSVIVIRFTSVHLRFLIFSYSNVLKENFAI